MTFIDCTKNTAVERSVNVLFQFFLVWADYKLKKNTKIIKHTSRSRAQSDPQKSHNLHADAPSNEPCSVSCSNTDKETRIHCLVSCFANVHNDSHVPASALQMEQLHFFQQLPLPKTSLRRGTYIPRDIKQRQGLFMWSIKVR